MEIGDYFEESGRIHRELSDIAERTKNMAIVGTATSQNSDFP